MKCSGCGEDGFYQKTHEATGKPYLVRVGSSIPHICKPKRDGRDLYWCPACGDNGTFIPKINPCVHRRPDELRAFHAEQEKLHSPQKTLFGDSS